MFGFPHKDKSIKRLLVIRFSAMGDVALTVPVLHALATQHPELRITMLTRQRLVPLFEWVPSNVTVKGINLDDYKGVAGLNRLYSQLAKGHFDAVADLHDVLRTKYLRMRFALGNTRVAVIDKGRQEKKQLIGCGQTAQPLKPVLERYVDVFQALGLEMTLPPRMDLKINGASYAPIRSFTGQKTEGEKWVGVAPFAAHPQKVYPLQKMQQVVQLLAQRGVKVFLFGAGQQETKVLTSWEQPGVVCTSKKLGNLHNEMLLMSQLDLMIAMDSANMHIASLFSKPVLSIWGATHPKAGFLGYGQTADSIMQLDLPCRPCSVYGKKPCAFGDLRCMDFAPEKIVEKAVSMIS